METDQLGLARAQREFKVDLSPYILELKKIIGELRKPSYEPDKLDKGIHSRVEELQGLLPRRVLI